MIWVYPIQKPMSYSISCMCNSSLMHFVRLKLRLLEDPKLYFPLSATVISVDWRVLLWRIRFRLLDEVDRMPGYDIVCITGVTPVSRLTPNLPSPFSPYFQSKGWDKCKSNMLRGTISGESPACCLLTSAFCFTTFWKAFDKGSIVFPISTFRNGTFMLCKLLCTWLDGARRWLIWQMVRILYKRLCRSMRARMLLRRMLL